MCLFKEININQMLESKLHELLHGKVSGGVKWMCKIRMMVHGTLTLQED